MFGVIASSSNRHGGHHSDSDRGCTSKHVVKQHISYEETTKKGHEKERENFKKMGFFNFITSKRNEEHHSNQYSRRASDPHVSERLTLNPRSPMSPTDQHSPKTPRHHGILHGFFSSHSTEEKRSTYKKEKKNKKHKHAETTPIPRVTQV